MTWQLISTASKKAMVANPMNAFSNDIYECMFQHWIKYVGGNKNPVLKDMNSAKCVGLGLCYGGPNRMIKKKRVAQFSACYNQVTLIPEFTGHLIQPDIPDQGGREEFREDNSVGNHYSNSLLLAYVCAHNFKVLL